MIGEHTTDSAGTVHMFMPSAVGIRHASKLFVATGVAVGAGVVRYGAQAEVVTPQQQRHIWNHQDVPSIRSRPLDIRPTTGASSMLEFVSGQLGALVASLEGMSSTLLHTALCEAETQVRCDVHS